MLTIKTVDEELIVGCREGLATNSLLIQSNDDDDDIVT